LGQWGNPESLVGIASPQRSWRIEPLNHYPTFGMLFAIFSILQISIYFYEATAVCFFVAAADN
jgi:hypothetical protein